MSDPVTAEIELGVGDWRLRAKISVPAEPAPLRVMLPVFQSLADGMVDLAVRRVEEEGKTISCKKGCGACCRQLVPISEMEARHIRDLVEEMPEPRKTQIKARFAAAHRRLEESGMLHKLRERSNWSDEEFKKVGLEYFYLGIPCPFLEDESCSIHPERPITCREYLVTSPAENCARPAPDNIDWVPLAAKVWTAVARFHAVADSARYLRWVPLILAPEWAESHGEELPERSGPDWLKELLQRIASEQSEPAHD